MDSELVIFPVKNRREQSKEDLLPSFVGLQGLLESSNDKVIVMSGFSTGHISVASIAVGLPLWILYHSIVN